MKRTALLICTLFLSGRLFAATGKDTVHIFFKLNEETIQKAQQAKLDSLLYNDVVNSNTSLLIIGYADFLGSEEHNLGLSERRAKAIQQYFIKMRVPAANIKLVIGNGEVSRRSADPAGYAPDRRVDIAISSISRKPAAGKPHKSAIKTGELSPAKGGGYEVLTNMKKGQLLRLENIYFVMGRHMVTDESFAQLDKLFETLVDNPDLKIQIEGHVCCLQYGYDAEDEDTHETMLSVNRARFIYEYLVKKGIDKDRLKYVGFGRSRPLVSPERSPKDEDLNRRVEIRVMDK